MQDLNYVERISNLAVFYELEKKIIATLGEDSHAIRMKFSDKKKFTDTTMIVSLKNRE